MISVLGLGPGDSKYILPAVIEEISSSDMVIGAKRNIEAVNEYIVDSIEIKKNLKEIVEYINSHHKKLKIVVIVSGDTGFYSLLRYLKKEVSDVKMKVIPGISSMSYMFAKLNRLYDDAYLISMHGKTADIVAAVKENSKTGVLTDETNTPAKIAALLKANNIINCELYIGENLSYENEKITKFTVEEAIVYSSSKLCVMVVINE